MNFIDLQAQYCSIKEQIDTAIQQVLSHGRYIMGPEVVELEEKLAEYTGVNHVVSCANGTDALQLALMALDIQPGDAVFCPSFTFFASAEAISLVGATPVFVDVDEQTFNISPWDLEQKIKAVISEGRLNPRAIMAVNLFGLPADYPELNAIAKQYQLKIIEDAAQGFGGSINGKKACSFGDVATTSFFPAKPLGCYGDGGAIFTNDEGMAALLKSLRVHGQGKDKYDNVRIGMNSRLDTLQAAVLLEKLKAFPQELIMRQELAGYYNDSLSEIVDVPLVPETYLSAWAQYTINIPERDELAVKLKEKGVPSAVYYGRGMHQQSAYANAQLYGSLERSEKLTTRVLSLPMHPYINDSEREKVVRAVKSSVSSQV